MKKKRRIKIGISLIFRLLLIIAAVYALTKGDWVNAFLSIITFALTFLPSFVVKKYKFDYPTEFEILIVVFIYASIFFGGVLSFYEMFWWWDFMLHTLSGIIIGIIGFSLVYSLNRNYKPLNLSIAFIAIFSFSFAVAIGALWEIFEFVMDVLFNANMQKSGLVDTMWDLIVDSLGGLVMSLLGYFYLKGNISLSEKLDKAINKILS